MKSQLVTMSILAGLTVTQNPVSAAGGIINATKTHTSQAIDGSEMQKFFVFELEQEQRYVRTLISKEQNLQRKEDLQAHLRALKNLSQRNEELADPLRGLIRLTQEGRKLGSRDIETTLQVLFESAKERMIQTREKAGLVWREWEKNPQTAGKN